MLSLKQDNDRLQRLVSTKSLTSSHSSLPLRNSSESLERRLSASENSGPSSIGKYSSINALHSLLMIRNLLFIEMAAK